MFDATKLVNPIVAGLKPSGIRKYFSIAETIPDAISLGVGEPDFITPDHIMDAGINSLRAGKTQYTANNGLIQLRREISAYMERRFNLSYHPEKEIICTVGGSEALDIVFRAFLQPGDEIIIPEPCFVAYPALATMCGAKVVPIKTVKEDSFKLTPEQLKAAITPKTKLLLLSYPSNPTGGVMTKDELEAIAAVLRDTNIMVISDEIYAELTYGFEHTSIASLPGMRERTVIVSGFSKAFAMTGWRMGYCCAPESVFKYIAQIHQYIIMSAPTPAQYAAIEALQNGQKDCDYMREEYNKRRKFLHTELCRMGFDCFEPEGAFYIFPNVAMFAKDGEDFVEKLLDEEHVAVVPGSAFGDSGKDHIRISYAYSIERIGEALQRIERFVNKRK